MQVLPIGEQNFSEIRKNNWLYIDKTKQILQMLKKGKYYFLSRPRRFGKSLTISTLEAMFQGNAELFKGLYAEEWVKEQANHPNPVITLDISGLDSYENIKEIDESLINDLQHIANIYKLNIDKEKKAKAMFKKLIYALYERFGSVAVLVDEYDFPITEYIDDIKKANKVRTFLRSFYGVLKTYSKYLRFVFITGISKFSKLGIFSGFNNLKDISTDKKYSDIVGYTQKELECNFEDWIEKTSKEMSMNKEELLKEIKYYYDGFSFDGITKVYNPFSVLNFFDEGEFGNYWYNSATPSFLAKYLKKHKIKDQKEFTNKKVSIDFTNSREIENATVESFLYQAGYLTISKREGKIITLDYPNEEVRSSMTQLLLDSFYNIADYTNLGYELWEATKNADIKKIVDIFNEALKPIPYDDYPNRGEFWYRSLFMMLLYTTRLLAFPEPHTFDGRPDIVIPFDDKLIILEFKFAKTSSDVDKKLERAEDQVAHYAESYKNAGKKIVTAVLVIDNNKKQVTSYQQNL